jgi:Tol biopolymer transport system component
MINKSFPILLMLSFLVFGCGNITNPTGENIITPPVQSTQMIPPSPLPVSTATLKPTSTTAATLLTKQCLNVSSSHTWDDSLAGTLVLVSPNLSENYFLDMKTGKKFLVTKTEDDLAGDFSVSPNGNWLAYVGGKINEADMLVIESADGKERFTYPQDYQEWQSIAYWLDDKTLVLWHHANPLDNIILFNPFTGDKKTMGLEYPNILLEDDIWDFSWPSVTIYDRSLRRLVYLATGKDGFKVGNATLVLWDRNANRPITEISDLGFTLVYPLWKSDGSGLVYVKSETGMHPPEKAEELFFLSLDGKNDQLTKLSDYFQKATIYSYSWSPDERFIAFDLEGISAGEQEWKKHLLILDMSNLEVIDYCLSPEQFTPLIWSPDSRYLAFSQPLSGEDARTVVLDVLKGYALVAVEHLRPAGWLISEK